MSLGLSCLFAGNTECLNCFLLGLIAAYNNLSVVQYLVEWSESKAERNQEVKFQKYWEQWFCLAHINLPQTSTHLHYQKRSLCGILNLHHFLEMMDIEVENIPSIHMKQYWHILWHCPVHMLNKLVNDCTSRVLPY
jgi:hypothetical protein